MVFGVGRHLQVMDSYMIGLHAAGPPVSLHLVARPELWQIASFDVVRDELLT